MRRTLRSLLVSAALVTAWPAAQALGAESHAGAIDSVRLTSRSGYVINQAVFVDEGGGSSEISAWIEVFDRSGGSRVLSHRTQRTGCQDGHRCYTTLQPVTSVNPGECFVGWASTRPEGGNTQTRSSDRLCP
jgi:hypothetical protein